MTSYEIENDYDSRTWLHQKFDGKTWVLSQDYEVDSDETTHDDVYFTRAALVKLRDALDEILEER